MSVVLIISSVHYNENAIQNIFGNVSDKVKN